MKTALLMAMLTALLMFCGKALGGNQGMMYMFAFGSLMNFYYYWNSDSIVLRQYRAQQIDRGNAPMLYAMVERLAKKAEIPMPKVYVINTDVPNAFATGRNPEHAAVAINTGLARMLDDDELEGVIAHELSHIKHRDILTSTIAGCMANLITNIAHFAAFFGGGRDDENRNPIATLAMLFLAPLAAGMIQMAISRSREYEADRSGGEISGKPDALADALLKIESYAKRSRVMPGASEATAHMFIINPFTGKDFKSLFSTHPSTEERVALLREQARKMGR